MLTVSPRPCPARRTTLLLLALALCPMSARAQVTPDQAADMLLGSARRAYNEKNYPFAAQRFKEYLDRFGGHKEAPAARYGLALALLEGPEKDYARALDALQPLAGAKDFPDRPFVLYYLGLAQRGLGVRELTQAETKPQEAPQRRNAANARFDEAAKHFAAATPAFADLEWSARARCDQAEMQLRILKTKEAQATAAPFLKDPALEKSRLRPLGLYYHGYASFLLKDYQTAGHSLNRPALFADPVFGTHARYLVARIHHQGDEGAEAAAQYEAVVADQAKRKQDAAEALKRPDQFKNDPEEKARLEALAHGKTPEFVARAGFYLGVLLYEGGRFADAQARLTAFVQQNLNAPLAADAQLRLGFCLVQLKQFADAVKTLQPLADKEPRLADQALLWIAKAQAGAADPAKPQEYDQALKSALDTFRRAAEKAQQRAAADPEAKSRRADILLEMADTRQLARQYKEAAGVYAQLLGEKALPEREEEIMQRQAAALHLAGDYAESDRVCDHFRQAFPKSSLLPAVLFRRAENAYFVALAAEKNAGLPDRANHLAKLNEEVVRRYGVVAEKYPEFAYVNLARYGIAAAHYRKGDLEKALDVLKTIPDAERTGDLAPVPYLQADCLIRSAPAQADDALAAGKLQEQLESAAGLLEAFVGAQPNGPQTPDALLKLGYCRQRMAALLVQPQEKQKGFASARAAYERLIQTFPKHESQPTAVLERSKCLAQAGDVNGAVNELRRFGNDQALKASSVAPMASLQLATYLRSQNKATEAVDVLAQCRQQHEANLQKDPSRAGWVPLLQYHHGVALKEAGKRVEARAVLDLVMRQSPGRPEAAEAALRWGQSLKDDGLQKIADARKKLATNPKPEEASAAKKALEDGLKDVRDAVQYLEARAEEVKGRQPPVEARARMIYEAAWGYRTLAEAESKPAGEAAAQKARGHYRELLKAFPDAPLAGDARLELAELHTERGDHDGAIALLREGLDKEPPAELTERIRVRLGACLAAKGDPKAALAQFAAVAANPKSPHAAQALYRSGECLMTQGQYAEAVKSLSVFRDRGEFHNVAGVSDKALLRLGHALAQLKQWDASRQAHETLVGRFGNGPWVHEARYGVGWAWQNQKQYDQAVNAYSQVVNGTTTEVAAKAQLQIGLCRLEQKRYPEASSALLVVPFTYDYPEWSAVALCEAARAFAEQKQTGQAVRLLERVVRDHGMSAWAGVAKQRLGALKKS